ncbi:VWA domain-containing protein [Xanthomonas albilineans]|uniref:VWA domain-containing protein n=1 Tax=Xanthomonas albilineans TaxID=29447 RepID=UPI0027D970A5|nr:VWA domain-containing protein [Xanthomonas albilineans]
MSYTAEISRTSPTAFLFLVDQSGSMQEVMTNGKSKAQFVADVLNRTLAALITRCTKSEGTRNYFEIGVLGYSGSDVQNGLAGALSHTVLNPISEIEANPLRVEDRVKRVDDGAGGLASQSIKFPVWFEARASGGTPMCNAITSAAAELVAWCDAHPDSYPPTVLHVTDGESTDGDPEGLAQQLQQISTSDGNVLLFNLHVSVSGDDPVAFPVSDAGLSDKYAKLLFRISSPLTPRLQQAAQEKGIKATMESRGFMFNAETAEIVDFFDIGTRAAQLR